MRKIVRLCLYIFIPVFTLYLSHLVAVNWTSILVGDSPAYFILKPIVQVSAEIDKINGQVADIELVVSIITGIGILFLRNK